MEPTRERSVSQVLKSGYSEAEIDNLYALGRFFIETGNNKSAETIFQGITDVAPEYLPAILGLVAVNISNGEFDSGLKLSRRAVVLDSTSFVAALFLVTCQLIVKDFNAAGTLLGEMGEKIEGGVVTDRDMIRFYRIQLAKYQTREL